MEHYSLTVENVCKQAHKVIERAKEKQRQSLHGPMRFLRASCRCVAAVWVRPLPRTESPGCVPGSSMLFSPLITASKMTI